MNTIKFTLNVAAMDCYVYGGYIFLVRINGDVVYIPMSRIMHRLYDMYPHYKSLLIMAFSRNDYFSSTTGRLYLGVPEVFEAMRRAWNDASENMVFTLDWDDIAEDATVICGIQSQVLDLRMYAMHLFLGCRDGLYTSNLLVDDDKYTIHPNKPIRRFDAKIISLNSGYGSIIISSGHDGLFHAPLDADGEIMVSDRPVAAVSFRTGWSSSDILNYENSSVFEYLENDVQKLQRQVRYSRFDDSGERTRLMNIGSRRFSMEEVFSNTHILPQDVLFSFNSSQSAFLYTREGMYVVNLLKTDDRKDIYLSSRKKEISHNENILIDRPISASVIPAGCVVEFYDKVMMFQGNQIAEIESEPTMRVRSFMNSVRYRNIIATVKMNDVTLHSVAPFDTYKFVQHVNSSHLIGSNGESVNTSDFDLPF